MNTEQLETQETLNFIRTTLGEAALYEQLAEECVELAQAALKKARILRADNPTPVTSDEADRMITEEFTDVLNCGRLLELEMDERMANRKLDRLVKRIDAERMVCVEI